MKIVAFIPIKLNNERLPGKNTLPLGSKITCEYIFDTIKKVPYISKKYVYCSDTSIKQYLPAEIEFLQRNIYLDGFEIRGLEIIEHFVRDVDADIYILTHVTQPFVKSSSISTALNKVINEGYDSAFSVVEMKDYCWYKGNPLNYDIKNIVRTQELEPIYIETGAFFIFRKDVFIKHHQRIGINPYTCIIDQFEAVDIDTLQDYEFAKVVAMYLNSKDI